jgi:hypothetical protein
MLQGPIKGLGARWASDSVVISVAVAQLAGSRLSKPTLAAGSARLVAKKYRLHAARR